MFADRIGPSHGGSVFETAALQHTPVRKMSNNPQTQKLRIHC